MTRSSDNPGTPQAEAKSDAIVRTPSTRIPGVNKLRWPTALAWICTRDREFVASYDEKLGPNTSLDEAIRTLDGDLSEWLDERPGRSWMPRRLIGGQTVFHARRRTSQDKQLFAEDQLRSLLENGDLKATGENCKTSQIDPINRWYLFEDLGRHPHHAFFDWSVERCTFRELQIDTSQVLARWPEWSDQLTEQFGGPRWSLDQTLYWVERRTHRGFLDPTTRRQNAELRQIGDQGRIRKEVPDLDSSGLIRSTSRHSRLESAAELLSRLRADLVCEVSLKADAIVADPGHVKMQEREGTFWKSYGFGSVAEAWFRKADILERWPHHPNIDFTGIETRQAGYKLVRDLGLGMKPGELKKLVDRAIPAGRRGRPKAAN